VEEKEYLELRPVVKSQKRKRGEYQSVIHKWNNEKGWEYYPDSDSSDDEEEKDDGPLFVFSKTLGLSQRNIVRPVDWDITKKGRHFVHTASQTAMTLWEICNDSTTSTKIGWGDESDQYCWEPFLMPWTEGRELNKDNLLEALGAHRSFLRRGHSNRRRIVDVGAVVDSDNVEILRNKKGQQAMRAWWNKFPQKCCFSAGAHVVNPMPCFAVALVESNLVAGFIGGIIQTP